MGNIGEPRRHIEFEPLEEPVPGRNVPVGPSGPAPVEVPEKTPEKVSQRSEIVTGAPLGVLAS